MGELLQLTLWCQLALPCNAVHGKCPLGCWMVCICTLETSADQGGSKSPAMTWAEPMDELIETGFGEASVALVGR